MPLSETEARIDSLAAIEAVAHALEKIDVRLMDHGGRVAFLACELCEAGDLPLDEEKLFLLSLFHDIGAYKTDEIDRMVEFETCDVEHHSTYGYLFLKHMSPLSEFAEAVLHHHTPWPEIEHADVACKDYASLICLADRMDIAHLNRMDSQLAEKLADKGSRRFRPEYVELATRHCAKRWLFERLADGSYRQANVERVERFRVPPEAALEYLRMLVFAIDFRSEFTVTHTVNTTSIALDIARHFGVSEHDLNAIYLGALLHDVGKVAISPGILEHPGRLTDEQMSTMRTHVQETESIISRLVSDEVCQIAVRHHEKLDGTGYPRGLTGAELSFSQRVVAVADIVSALVSRRSYKEPFPKEKTTAILRDMRGTQLDAAVCDYLCQEYDDIVRRTDNSRNEVVRKYAAMLTEYQQMAPGA